MHVHICRLPRPKLQPNSPNQTSPAVHSLSRHSRDPAGAHATRPRRWGPRDQAGAAPLFHLLCLGGTVRCSRRSRAPDRLACAEKAAAAVATNSIKFHFRIATELQDCSGCQFGSQQERVQHARAVVGAVLADSASGEGSPRADHAARGSGRPGSCNAERRPRGRDRRAARRLRAPRRRVPGRRRRRRVGRQP